MYINERHRPEGKIKQSKASIHHFKLLIKILVLVSLASFLFLADCRKKEEPVVSAPVYSQNEMRSLRDAVNRHPKDITAWINLGNAFMDNRRYQEAIDAYQKALELDPKDVDVRVDMGTCFRNIGQPARAVEEYRKAIAINPGHLNAHRNLGIVLGFDLGDKETAIKELEEFIRLSPNGPQADSARKTIEKLKKS